MNASGDTQVGAFYSSCIRFLSNLIRLACLLRAVAERLLSVQRSKGEESPQHTTHASVYLQ